MNDLVSDRPMRVAHVLGELFLRSWSDIGILYLAIYSEVIVVEIAKGV